MVLLNMNQTQNYVIAKIFLLKKIFMNISIEKLFLMQQMHGLMKLICFISEYLVLIVPKETIVSNMHEAYDRLKAMGDASSKYGFGTFISGPSKTADIEQALVYGAQAARGMTILVC